MVLSTVFSDFLLLQTANTITSATSRQPDDPRITQLLATHYGYSKQYSQGQFSRIRVRNGTQAPCETEYTRTLTSAFVRAKVKKKLLGALQLIKTIDPLLLKEDIPKGVDMILWIVILTPCHNQKN